MHKIYLERLVSPKILDVLLKLDLTAVSLNTFEAFITFLSKFKGVIVLLRRMHATNVDGYQRRRLIISLTETYCDGADQIYVVVVSKPT